MGLNSGEVVVRAIGSDLRMDYTAVGQTTHLAARMEQLAPPGTIRLTAETLRLAEGYIEVKPLGPVPVKGLETPIDVFEMVGAGPRRSRLHAAAARGLTRFVGREAELEQLRHALARAAAGHGQVVAIVGEPGVGKSRLVWEVTHSHRVHGWLVLHLDTVVESAARLCEAYDASLLLRRDNRLVMAAHHGPIHDAPAIARALGTIGVYTLSLDRGTIGGRTVLDARTVRIADVQVEAEEFPEASENARRLGFHTMLSVPLMREGVAIGAIQLPRTEVRLFTERQVALLKTFANQAVIAIENVRLFNETKEALEQQTATAEILRVIASSPTDLQPVMDVVAESAARFCGATDASIWHLEGEVLRRAAAHGLLPASTSIGGTIAVTLRDVAGRAVLDRETIHIEDLLAPSEADFPETQERLRHLDVPTRTILATPLLREDVPIGVIVMRRGEVLPFTEKQIELAKTFADQAVIAIENVRLFTELETRNRELTSRWSSRRRPAKSCR